MLHRRHRRAIPCLADLHHCATPAEPTNDRAEPSPLVPEAATSRQELRLVAAENIPLRSLRLLPAAAGALHAVVEPGHVGDQMFAALAGDIEHRHLDPGDRLL